MLIPDGKQFLVASRDTAKYTVTPTLIDIHTQKVVVTFPPVEEADLRLYLDPTGRTLVGRSLSGTRVGKDFYGPAHLWDFPNRKYLAIIATRAEAHSLDFSPDGKRVLTGGPSQANIIWDAKTGEELFALQYEPLTKDIQSVGLSSDWNVFSDDGTKVIMACTDGAVRIFNSLPWKTQPKAARK